MLLALGDVATSITQLLQIRFIDHCRGEDTKIDKSLRNNEFSVRFHLPIMLEKLHTRSLNNTVAQIRSEQ